MTASGGKRSAAKQASVSLQASGNALRTAATRQRMKACGSLSPASSDSQAARPARPSSQCATSDVLP